MDDLKSGIDLIQGVLSTLLLASLDHASRDRLLSAPEEVDALLGWLTATDTFEQEARRLEAWQRFLGGQSAARANRYLEQAIALAAWFEVRSNAALGRHTVSVERFVAEMHPGYRWRKDAIFCSRRRVEYHLCMVATEILNQAFRKAFLDAAHKFVLLPPCMKARQDDRCQAVAGPLGARCRGCAPECRVNQLSSLGETQRVDVLIQPDDLTVYVNGTERESADSEIGIVGVSCVLTNPAGGWQMRDLGVPAQGVLLDYCGCQEHWHRDGFPTDVNVGQILRVLGW
jgi:hypothetical protein